MTVPQLLSDYTRYNLWANQQIVNWLSTKDVLLMSARTPSSFPSLRETIVHIWGAEHLWLERLQGRSPESFVGEDFSGGAHSLFAALLETSARFHDFVKGQPAKRFDTPCEFYTLARDQHFREIPTVMIQHCVQHSTFHRGQLVTMSRALGMINPPATDYIRYARIREKAL